MKKIKRKKVMTFLLASTMLTTTMPLNVLAEVTDKSSEFEDSSELEVSTDSEESIDSSTISSENQDSSEQTETEDNKVDTNSDNDEDKEVIEEKNVETTPSIKENSAMGPGFYDTDLGNQRMARSTNVFLDNIKKGAIDGWSRYKILPSISAAQAVLESGWGKSTLAINANNLFGIKGRYNGSYVIMPTLEYINGQWITVNAEFRKYPSWDASVEDHGSFFHENPRYSNLIGVTDYRTVARLLQEDGYATDPEYAAKLISIIEYNGLADWDVQALGNHSSKNSVKIIDLDLPTAQRWLDEIQKRYVGLITPDRVFGMKKGNDWSVKMTDVTYEQAVGICRIFRTIFPQYEIYGTRRNVNDSIVASTPFNVEITGIARGDADSVIREVRNQYYWLLTSDRIFITPLSSSYMIEVNSVPTNSVNGLKQELKTIYQLMDYQVQ